MLPALQLLTTFFLIYVFPSDDIYTLPVTTPVVGQNAYYQRSSTTVGHHACGEFRPAPAIRTPYCTVSWLWQRFAALVPAFCYQLLTSYDSRVTMLVYF